MDDIDLKVIAAGAGMLISVIALIRTFDIDRRVYWEPYFKGKWKDIEKILTSNKFANEQLLSLIDRVKDNSLYASAANEENLAANALTINLTSDKWIKRYITKSIKMREQIRQLIETYRDLDFPMHDLTAIVRTQRFYLNDKTDDEKDETFRRMKSRDTRYFNVLKKYSPSTYSSHPLSSFFELWEEIKDKEISEQDSFLEIVYTTRCQEKPSHEFIRSTIANNSRYKKDLSNTIRKMDSLTNNLISLNTKIDAIIDFYRTKYSPVE